MGLTAKVAKKVYVPHKPGAYANGITIKLDQEYWQKELRKCSTCGEEKIAEDFPLIMGTIERTPQCRKCLWKAEL